ncbi:MAG: hypothetical protein ACRC1K_07280, partial [Planctomycetia bacterium]
MTSPPPTDSTEPQRTDAVGKTSWTKRVKQGVQLLLLVATSGAVARQAWLAWNEAGDAPFAVAPGWIAVAGGLYAVGLIFWGVSWRLALVDRGSATPFAATIGVYLFSHLGKYVPGKAMVVLLRVDWMGRLFDVGAARTTAASLYETLATMGAGALVAGGLLLALHGSAAPPDGSASWSLRAPTAGGALLLATAFGVALAPPVFLRA